MIIPDSDITPLDPRFPIAMGGTIPLFGGLLEEWVDRKTVIDQARRAAEQAARREERFVQPAPEPRYVPALAHEDTRVDFTLHDGDRFRPEDTQVTAGDVERWQAQRDAATDRTDRMGKVLLESPRAIERELRAARHHPLRRAWRRIRRT
jgi:hypothetical protein